MSGIDLDQSLKKNSEIYQEAIKQAIKGWEVSYRDIDDDNDIVRIEFARSREVMQELSLFDEDNLPKGVLPLLAISEWKAGQNEELDSVFGIVPTHLMDENGDIYYVSNGYMIDAAGNGFKSLKISLLHRDPNEPQESYVNNWIEEGEDLLEVDFELPESSIVYVPLQPDDYKIIDNILSRISDGRLEERTIYCY